jgi:hypothetical protein
MKNTLRKIVTGITLGFSTACAPFLGRGSVDYHPLNEGCVGGFPVEISYNDDESWRIIRIESPDGAYVGAEDYATDHDGRFNYFTYYPELELNHPLKKYASMDVLEQIYNDVKNGEISKCS